MADLLEAIMVISFGVSWPISIMKSLRAKTAKGKSLFFLLLILLGYAAGIASKIVSHNYRYVTYFYVFNFIVVGIDLIVYLRNRRIDKLAE